MHNIESLLAELMKLLEAPTKSVDNKIIEAAYKAYGFDPAKPPTDGELANWVTPLIYKWCYNVPNIMNLPLAGLCTAYNKTTFGKLSQLDQINLMTLLCVVYNIGYNMGAYKLRSPFDPKPEPKDLN